MSIYETSIDDNDSQIIYSDGWVLVTTDGDWKGTMHSTSNIGASARVRFTGTRVAFVCTIPTGDGQLSQASFSIDNGPAVKVTHATTPPVQWQTTFWDSGPLAYGSHLIVMTNVGNTAYLRLDRIDYDPTTANAPQVPPGTSAGAGAGDGVDKATTVKATLTSTVVVGASGVAADTQTLSTSSVAASTPLVIDSGSQSSTTTSAQSVSDSVSVRSQTGTSTSSTSSITGSASAIANLHDADSASAITAGSAGKAGTPVAAIVGGVLGGLLAIVLVVLALLYCRRRRARAAYLNDPSISRPSMSRGAGVMSTVPTPFGIDRRSHETISTSNLIVQAHPSSGILTDASSPTSAYHSESSTSAFYVGQQQYQHNGGFTPAVNGNNPSGALGSKHAEFMTEQQTRLVDTSVAGEQMRYGAVGGQPVLSLGGGSSGLGGFQDHDAPPAYPGMMQDVEASLGWKL